MSTKVLNTMVLLGRANKLIYGHSTTPSSSSTPPSPPGAEWPEPSCRTSTSSSVATTPTADSNVRHRTAPFKVSTPSMGTPSASPSTPPLTPTKACEPFLNTLSTATVSAASAKAPGTGSRCSSFISSNRHWEDEIAATAAVPPPAMDTPPVMGETSAKLSFLKPGPPLVIEHQPLPSMDCDLQMSANSVDTTVNLGQKVHLSRSDREESTDRLDEIEKPLIFWGNV